MMFLKLVISATLALSASAYTEDALKDQITNLPGAEGLDLKFNQFSGYLNIPGVSGNLTKYMHYWFVESMNDPANDPIGFWTNGGPGCSGLIGFMTEQGPFKPNKDMTLSLNEYAWNNIANMVFIESPAGVGFSKTTDPDDLVTGDAQTAEDNYNLIQAFLDRFPDLRSNSVYITSESYGGHYMPTLAKEIVDMNAEENGKPVINFKGFAVGNPYTDTYSGTGAMLDTFWGHQLVAKPTYDEYTEKCVNSLRPNVQDCIELQIAMNIQIGNLNVYALDYPVCVEDSQISHKSSAQRTWMLNAMYSHVSAADRKRLGIQSQEEYEPCEDDYTDTYLNLESVKQAIHVDGDINWQSCSYKVQYNMSDSSVSTAPIYNYLIDGGFGLDILVYSGDDDSVCATIGTQNWIWDLGYEVAGKKWQTYYVADQTAGYSTQWKNTKLGFLTIHGAGHEVPTYKPEVALDMWSRYLNGEFTNQ